MIQRRYYKTIRVIVDSDGGGTPFYIENIDSEPGYFTLAKKGSPTYTPNLNYRIDNGEWFEYDVVNLPRIEVPVGSKIYLKGNNTSGWKGTNPSPSNFYSIEIYTTISGTTGRKHNIGGYITSLLALDNFHLINNIPVYCFSSLLGQNLVVSAENLITSNITSVEDYAFSSCFAGCTSLVTAPTFENISSADGHSAFASCFQGCTSLVTAPTFENVISVGITTFSGCFYGCKSLVTAPTFENVTNMKNNCFNECFQGCTSLVVAPTFDKVTSVGYEVFNRCFYGCKSLVTAPTFDKVTSVGDEGFNECFVNCTSLVTAPTFDKVTSVEYCGFDTCFSGCTSLVTAPTFKNVTNIGNFSFIMCFKECTSLETIFAPRPSTWDTTNFSDWVQNVSTSGTFYKKKGLEIPTGTNGIPEGWTVVEEA